MIAWSIVIAGLVLGAGFLAERGTRVQAAMSKGRWLSDTNPLIANAASLWRPGPRWIRSRRVRTARRQAELAIEADAKEWARYQMLSREFFAWNDLESAVAMAFIASLVAFVSAVVSVATQN